MLWYEHLLGILAISTCIGYVIASLLGYSTIYVNHGVKLPGVLAANSPLSPTDQSIENKADECNIT